MLRWNFMFQSIHSTFFTPSNPIFHASFYSINTKHFWMIYSFHMSWCRVIVVSNHVRKPHRSILFSEWQNTTCYKLQFMPFQWTLTHPVGPSEHDIDSDCSSFILHENTPRQLRFMEAAAICIRVCRKRQWKRLWSTKNGYYNKFSAHLLLPAAHTHHKSNSNFIVFSPHHSE